MNGRRWVEKLLPPPPLMCLAFSSYLSFERWEDVRFAETFNCELFLIRLALCDEHLKREEMRWVKRANKGVSEYACVCTTADELLDVIVSLEVFLSECSREFLLPSREQFTNRRTFGCLELTLTLIFLESQLPTNSRRGYLKHHIHREVQDTCYLPFLWQWEDIISELSIFLHQLLWGLRKWGRVFSRRAPASTRPPTTGQHRLSC